MNIPTTIVDQFLPMNFTIYATGQFMENYGAHDWDGEGECPQYWKCKGSERVVMYKDVSLDDLPAMLEKAATEYQNHSESNDYCSLSCSGIEYFPANITSACMELIEYGMDHSMYIMGLTDEDVEIATRFMRFMGKD